MISPDIAKSEFHIRHMTPAEAEITEYDPSISDKEAKLTALFTRHLINLSRYGDAYIEASIDKRKHIDGLINASNDFVFGMAQHYGVEVDFCHAYRNAQSAVIGLAVIAEQVDECSADNYTEIPQNPGRVFVPTAEMGQSWDAWKGMDG